MLKAGSKKINPNKRRKKIPILGTLKEFKSAEKQFNSESQSQSSFVSVDKPDIEIENLDGKK